MSVSPQPSQRLPSRFTAEEIPRLVTMYGFIAALHVIGWGLFLHYNAIAQYHDLQDDKGTLLYASAGALAYTFGLRHAFDADHISAIDDTTRYLLQKGRRPLAVGLFFSLGHSTIVFVMAAAIAVAAKAAARFQNGFEGTGALIGTLVSGTFLYLIAALNLAVIVGIWRMWRQARRGEYRPEQLDELLASRGFMNRIFRGRYNKFINHSWQLYPVGVLFGLGFDTATEVALLALSAAAAAGATGTALPPLAIIALPILFAAGMTLMDTSDGVFMSKAYGWAFVTPLRKIYYNITTTALSIFVAFFVGTVELLGLLTTRLHLDNRQPWASIASIDINLLGRFIVATFVVVWIAAVVYWKWRRFDDLTPTYAADAEIEARSAPDAP